MKKCCGTKCTGRFIHTTVRILGGNGFLFNRFLMFFFKGFCLRNYQTSRIFSIPWTNTCLLPDRFPLHTSNKMQIQVDLLDPYKLQICTISETLISISRSSNDVACWLRGFASLGARQYSIDVPAFFWHMYKNTISFQENLPPKFEPLN